MSRNLLSMNGPLAGLPTAFMLAATLAAPAHAAHTPADPEQRVLDFGSCAKPQYPAADLKARHTGKVTLRYKIDPTGTILDSKVEKSSGFPGLDEEARSAIAKCRFSPAKAGVKSDEWKVVQYDWRLN